MLCFCTVLAIVSVAFAQDPELLTPYPELTPTRPSVPFGFNESLRMQQEIEKCREYTGVEGATIRRLFKFETLDPNVANKDFLYCLLTGLEYATKDGHLHQDVLKLYDGHPYKKDVKFIFDQCNNLENKFLYVDTLFDVVQCFVTKTPIIVGGDN